MHVEMLCPIRGTLEKHNAGRARTVQTLMERISNIADTAWNLDFDANNAGGRFVTYDVFRAHVDKADADLDAVALHAREAKRLANASREEIDTELKSCKVG